MPLSNGDFVKETMRLVRLMRFTMAVGAPENMPRNILKTAILTSFDMPGTLFDVMTTYPLPELGGWCKDNANDIFSR